MKFNSLSLSTIQDDDEISNSSSDDDEQNNMDDIQPLFQFNSNDPILTPALIPAPDSDSEDEHSPEIPSNDVSDDNLSDMESASDSDSDSDEPDNADDNASDASSDHDPEDIVNEKRKADYFEKMITPDQEDESFTNMRLSRPILKGIASLGFTKPTIIQSRTIPVALQGKDICGSAVTGSGKTGAFIIPVLERLLFRPKDVASTRVLILVPTRELGVQCHKVGMDLAKFTDIQFCLCVGGLPTKQQELELKNRPDVVIATPGRLIDHIHNSHSFNLDSIEILIMDEADRMLEDGFAAELDEIIKNTSKSRQTMLFSATMTDNVDDLIKLSLNRPVRLFVDSATSIASRLTQEFIRVRSHREESRPAVLAALCSRTYKTETIVFFKSKASAHHTKVMFGLLGFKAAELHGNLTQAQRLEALELFKEKKVDFLLATDLASRGLDINGIKTVINYDMPRNYAQYVHRVGRTARASKSGRAVSLVGEADRSVLKLAIKNSKDQVKHRIVPSSVVQKFEGKIEKLADAIKQIYKEEKEEKEFRVTEMEMNKAQNMIQHEDEIKSRPARVWFQSENQKAESKALGTSKHNNDFGLSNDSSKKRPTESKQTKNGKFDGLSRHKKRLKLSREEDSSELIKQKAAVRSIKSSTKPKKMTQIAESKAKSIPATTKKVKKVFDQEMVIKKATKAVSTGVKHAKNSGGKKSFGKSAVPRNQLSMGIKAKQLLPTFTVPDDIKSSIEKLQSGAVSSTDIWLSSGDTLVDMQLSLENNHQQTPNVKLLSSTQIHVTYPTNDTIINISDSMHSVGWPISALGISPDSNYIVAGGTNGRMAILQSIDETIRLKTALEGHYSDITTCKFFPSGQVVLSASLDMSLKIWGLDASQPVNYVGHSGGVLDASIISTGRNILSCSRDGSINLWETGTGCVIHKWNPQIGNLNKISMGAFSSTGSDLDSREVETQDKIVFTVSADGIIAGYDLGSKTQAFINNPGNGALSSVAFDGCYSLACGSNNGVVSIYDVRNFKNLVSSFTRSDAKIESLRFGADASIFCTSSESCAIIDFKQGIIEHELVKSSRETLLSFDMIQDKYVYVGGKLGIIHRYSI